MISTAILNYLVLSSFFLIWRPDHFLKDVLVAPLFFIIPLGLGLVVVRAFLGRQLKEETVGKLPLILLALFVGLTGHTVLYQQLERVNLLQSLYPFLYPSAFCGAAFSFYRETRLFHVEWTGREWLTRAATVIPLLALTYSFYFLKFTAYPLRDIFQETHFMKGAMELARFHVLNPYTADSYIPLLQVHLGLLRDWYGYDLIASQWILPILCAGVRYACIHCFFSVLTDSKLAQTIAAALAVITLQNLFSPTNGDFLFSLCLLTIALLIRAWGAGHSSRAVGLSAISLMVFAVVLYKVSSVQTIGIFWTLTVLGAAWYSRTVKNAASPVMACAVLLCATGVALHPAVALLYLVCAIGLVVIRQVLYAWWPTWTEVFRARALLGFAVVTGMMVVLFGLELRDIFVTKESRPVLSMAAEWILGKEITGAEGMRNTMIEWVRLAPPAFLALGGLLSISSAHAMWPKLLSPGQHKQPGDPGSLSLLFAWVGCLAALLLSFSGMPYVHRALYFPLILCCLTMAILICEELRRYWAEGSRVILVKYGILMLSYLVVGGRYGYKVPELGGATINPYLLELSPYFGLAALGVAVLLTFAMVSRSPRRVVVLTLAIILVGVASDKFAIKSYGYRYSYGDNWPRERPISHYTEAELEMADRIRSLPMNTIVVSDPYTLSIIQAQTGLNGLYSFANLGVMREEYKEAVREILKHIQDCISGNYAGESDTVPARVTNFIAVYPGATPELRYAYEQRMQRALNLQEVREDLLIILNAERTFSWMNGQEGYFPRRPDMTLSFDEPQIAKAFQVIHNIGNKVLALRLIKSKE